MTRRPLVAALIAALAVTSAFAFVMSRPAADGTLAAPEGSSAAKGATKTPIPIPIPGHEVYGFVPYWEMDGGIAAHLAETDLTTLALFSVTHKKNGDLASGERGYRRIDGPLGRQLIREAHDTAPRLPHRPP